MQDETAKASSDRKFSKAGSGDAEGAHVELEIDYMEFEERFINFRIVLIILTGITLVAIVGAAGVFAYLHHVPEDLQALLSMVTLILGYGFFWVIPGIIIAKSDMRKVRKLQEILRSALANEQARGTCD